MYEPLDPKPPVTNEEIEDRLAQLEISVDTLGDELKKLREETARRFDAMEDALDAILKALEKQDDKLETIEIYTSNPR
ncbi:hypothetical protein [Caballeronia novacaledonica]|uniref:Uncharacterized protein n=1 Tax=Caballeronia novacaledonica TaxID=1544861 RepID=A0AA37I5W0_9BURK|nr:hypothetical protein [Caballeronia novacaledonica]GJH23702.1 hypothetical protein CBA19CS42_04320 [Caballeronia novacaledonica]